MAFVVSLLEVVRAVRVVLTVFLFPGRQIPERKEKQTVVKRCQVSTAFILKSRTLAKHNKG